MKALKLITTIIAILCTTLFSGNAQKSKFNDSSKDFKNRYSDYLNEDEKIKKSWYHYVTTETEDKKYFARVFYPETRQIISLEQYKSSKYKIKSGYAMYWTEEGVITSEGSFKDDKRVGIWKKYDRKTGKLKSEGSYKDNKRSNIWVNFKNEKPSSSYVYLDGKKEGEFIVFDSLGIVSNKGIYKSDTIFSQIKLSEPLEVGLDEKMPMFKSKKCEGILNLKEQTKCATEEMLKYIYKNLEYPDFARKYRIQGRALVQFTIDKNGDVIDIEFIKSMCQEIRNTCTKLIEGMPKWQPGTQDGVPVKVKYTLPILFRLEG